MGLAGSFGLRPFGSGGASHLGCRFTGMYYGWAVNIPLTRPAVTPVLGIVKKKESALRWGRERVIEDYLEVLSRQPFTGTVSAPSS